MSKKSTIEAFIIKANSRHNNKYDYSKVEYKGYNIPIKIICPIHGEFVQKPTLHLQTLGCQKCAGLKISSIHTLTQKDFIDKCNKIHNNKYDYSKIKYIKSDIPVCIICPIHGEFEQKPYLHSFGKGCKKCALLKVSITHKLTQEIFIERCKILHNNKYDYSKTIYNLTKNEIIITCPIHGDYSALAQSHLMGCGCKKCGRITFKKSRTLTKEHFIKRAVEKHGDKYNYSSINFINTFTPIDIICNEHGVFTQLPRQHTYGNGCPKCYKGGYSKSKWLKLANKNKNSLLYVIKVFNEVEEFIKIGITTHSVEKRFKNNDIPYKYIILKELENTPEKIWELERDLHKKFKTFKHKPLLEFAGQTECYTLQVLNILNNHIFRTIS